MWLWQLYLLTSMLCQTTISIHAFDKSNAWFIVSENHQFYPYICLWIEVKYNFFCCTLQIWIVIAVSYLEVSTWWVRTHLACTFVTPSDFLRLCYHPGKLPSVLPIYLWCDYGTLTLTNLTYSSTCNVYNHLSKV